MPWYQNFWRFLFIFFLSGLSCVQDWLRCIQRPRADRHYPPDITRSLLYKIVKCWELLTFALNGGWRPEGRPELLGAAVAARRHVVRNLQEDENSVRLSTCFDCRRCLDVLIFQVLSRAFPGRVLIGQTENFTCTYPLIGDLNRFIGKWWIVYPIKFSPLWPEKALVLS